MVGADRDEIHREAPLEEAEQPPTARQLHLPFTPFSIDLFGVPRYPFCQTKTDNNPVGFNLGDMHEEGLLQQMY